MNSSEKRSGRRNFLRGVATGAGAGLLGPLAAPREAGAATRRPNVLLVGSEGTGTVECGGLSPAIARLACAGFCFENFRGGYPFVEATWSDLLAGHWVSRQTASNQASTPKVTIASAFAHAGYRTVLAHTAGVAHMPNSGFSTVVGLKDREADRLPDFVFDQARRSAGTPYLAVAIYEAEAGVIDAAVSHLLAALDAWEHVDDPVIFYVPPLLQSDGNGLPSPCSTLVVYGRNRAASNGRSTVPMNPFDVAPTVCGFAGIARAASFVGTDYSALAAARAR